MNELENACLVSLIRWVGTIPDDLEEYSFSQHHQKEMEKLFSKMRNDKYHRFTKKTAKIIAIAAILISLAIASTVTAMITSSKYKITDYSDHSIYRMLSSNDAVSTNELNVDYMPEKYTLKNEYKGDNIISRTYSDSTGKITINIEKNISNAVIDFDTSTHTYKKVTDKSTTYIVAFSSTDDSSTIIIWNKNGFCYCIESVNTPYDELMEIAKSTF